MRRDRYWRRSSFPRAPRHRARMLPRRLSGAPSRGPCPRFPDPSSHAWSCCSLGAPSWLWLHRSRSLGQFRFDLLLGDVIAPALNRFQPRGGDLDVAGFDDFLADGFHAVALAMCACMAAPRAVSAAGFRVDAAVLLKAVIGITLITALAALLAARVEALIDLVIDRLEQDFAAAPLFTHPSTSRQRAQLAVPS